MKSIRKNKKGYTLVEVMVTVAILGIIFGGLASLMTMFTRYTRLNMARIDIQRDARTTMSLINKNLREAQSATVVIDQASGEPFWSRISFTSVNGNTIVYYQDDGKLYQTVNGKTIMLAQNMRTLRFSYPNTDDSAIISMSVCFEKSTYEGSKKALQLSVEKVRIMN